MQSELEEGLAQEFRGRRPNPSLKRSPNGRPHGPDRPCVVRFRQPGPAGMTLVPA